jgi:replicative DNA helicase
MNPKTTNHFETMTAALHAFEQDDTTRALPHALGPEKSLLSSMLQDPKEWIAVALEENLSPAHFYLPAHSALFEMLVELDAAGVEIELVSLVQRLLDRGQLDRIGGPAALTDLYTYAPSPGHFRQHLRHVRDKHVLRSLIQVSNQTIAGAYDNPEAATELLDATEAAVMAIRDTGDNRPEGTVKSAVGDVLQEMQQLLSGERESLGMPSGFPRMDAMTGGMKPGEMFVIAARPSMGKTALMMNIAESVCIDHEAPTLIFSAEMSRHALVKRLIHTRAKVAMSQVARGFALTKGDLQRIQRAAMEINAAPLTIDDTAGISISALRAKARRIHRNAGLKLVCIDYLQLLTSRSKQAMNSREREVAEISAGIKALAKELGTPILILAQLNRGPESRGGKAAGIPRLADLRESGAIEQDADIVGLLHRPGYYATDDNERAENEGRAELIVAKNRNGETGSAPLTWIADLMRFEDGAPAMEPPAPPTPRSRFD